MNGCEALRESELAQLVAQASTLYERLGPEWQPDEARWEAGQARARLATWQRLVAPGNLSQFEQRLARDGLDTRQALLRLGAARPSTGILPKWVETLQQALLSANAVLDQPLPVSDRCLDPEHPVPFQDVLLSFVRIARQRLLAQPDLHYDRLPQVCQAALEHALVRVLSMTGAQTLLLKFAVFRATRSLGDQSVLPDDTGRRYYSAFVSDLLNGGLRQVLQEYSVLARLLTMQTDQWIEATGEFLRRLQTDWPRLTSFQTSILGHRQEAQSVSDPFECLIGLKSSLSDSHHGGRSVIALEFASGVKLVYKPRDLGIEVAFQHLVVWLNDRGLTPRLMPLVVLNCGTHGWVEFVEHRPCNNRNEAMRYYERAGALLALMYVLGGTDCHYENLVASGPQPVLIEHEMLMCPDSMAQADGIDREVTRPQARSVLDTGLLPTCELGPGGHFFDASGLGNPSRLEQPASHLIWKHVNTDDMARVSDPLSATNISPPLNVPMLDGEPLSPREHLEDLIAGFRRAYHVILQNREALLSSDGPLAEFKGRKIRVTVRQTSLYRALLRTALAPRFMRDGADLSIQVDRLSRAWLAPDVPAFLWPISRAEHDALTRMDIPRFTTLTNSRSLNLNNGVVVENCFPETGYDLVRAQMVALSEADLEQQVGLIRASFEERLAQPESG